MKIGAGYTPPLMQVEPSTDGIIEWQSDHFDGQLRYNLIASKYMGPLYRIVLNPTGRAVIAASDPAIKLVGDKGLDVTQAPDGTLVEVRNPSNAIFFHKPFENLQTKLIIKSVFPRRGGQAGGTRMTIYGINFTGKLIATIAGVDCPIVSSTLNEIVCLIPGGTTGTADISVSNDSGELSKFSNGYRYISGKP